jgi:hypothetical protein
MRNYETTVNGRTTPQVDHGGSAATPSAEVDRQGARMDVRRAKMWLLGPRDYPEQVVTVPEHLVRDLPDLIAQAQRLNPAATPDAVVKTIWRLGSYRLGQNLIRRIPIRLAELLGADRAVTCRASKRPLGYGFH